jgi:hypothetical protein
LAIPGRPDGNLSAATPLSFPLLIREFGVEYLQRGVLEFGLKLERFDFKVEFIIHQSPSTCLEPKPPAGG